MLMSEFTHEVYKPRRKLLNCGIVALIGAVSTADIFFSATTGYIFKKTNQPSVDVLFSEMSFISEPEISTYQNSQHQTMIEYFASRILKNGDMVSMSAGIEDNKGLGINQAKLVDNLTELSVRVFSVGSVSGSSTDNLITEVDFFHDNSTKWSSSQIGLKGNTVKGQLNQSLLYTTFSNGSTFSNYTPSGAKYLFAKQLNQAQEVIDQVIRNDQILSPSLD